MMIMNNNKVMEIIEPATESRAAASAMNETEGEVSHPAVKAPADESMFFATGQFSIHHQPGDDDDAFMGE